jgi:transposase
MAHARRKLFEAHKLNGSQVAAQAVRLIAKIYETEREAQAFDPLARWRLRQSQAKPMAQTLHCATKSARDEKLMALMALKQ